MRHKKVKIKSLDLMDNRMPKEKYFKETYKTTGVGKPQMLKSGMKKDPMYESSGGKVEYAYGGMKMNKAKGENVAKYYGHGGKVAGCLPAQNKRP